MSTKARVTRLAEKYRAEFILNKSRPIDAEVWTPKGRSWACDPGLHVIVGSQWDDEKAGDVWQDMYDRMSIGTVSCSCHECITPEEEL